jgi:hypothetical protein
MSVVETNESSMMPSLLEFFGRKYNFDLLQEFINSNKNRSNKLSIGLLDWFNVNYSQEYGIEYIIRRGTTDRIFYVWQSYNAALHGYGKALFDPFARGSKKGHTVTISNGDIDISTTLCQLNYFMWAIKNGIIDYVRTNIDAIYDDMIVRSNRGGKKQVGEKKKKLSVSASKTLGYHDIKMVIKFN